MYDFQLPGISFGQGRRERQKVGRSTDSLWSTTSQDSMNPCLIFDFVVRFITSSSSCSLVCSCAVLGTYRVWWAGVSPAAAEGWRGGSGRSCSASCSSYTRTRELWPLCCWTKGAPLSRWWPTGAGSWLSSDCAKAWSGNVLLQETGEENGDGVSDVDGQSGQRLLDKWTITIFFLS